MENINVTCTHCGETYLEDLSNITSTCPKCKKEFETAKGSKYYKSLQKVQKQENKKIISEIYNQIDLLIDKAQYYLDNEKYELCEKTLNELLKLNDKDRRVYLLFVYLKTKNFTELKDKTHYPYLERLIELSNEDEKKQIKKLYSVYYKKSNLTDDELQEYNDNLAVRKKESIEQSLKDGIPIHYENTRKVRVFNVLAVIATLIFATLLILHFTLKIDALLYVASAFSPVLLYLLITLFNTKPKIKLYDTYLDLYDSFDDFDLTTDQKLCVLKHLSTLCEIFLNGGSNYNLNSYTFLLTSDLVSFNNDKVLEFVLKYKTLSKYLKK